MTVRILPQTADEGKLLQQAEAWEKQVFPAHGVYAARFHSKVGEWGALVYLAAPGAEDASSLHPPLLFVYPLEKPHLEQHGEQPIGELTFLERIGEVDLIPGEQLASARLADHAAIAGRILGVHPL